MATATPANAPAPAAAPAAEKAAPLTAKPEPTYEELEAQANAIQNKLREMRAKELMAAKEAFEAVLRKHGYGSVAEYVGHSPAAPRRRAKSEVEAKYKDPKSGQTWAGRGRQPAWVIAHLKAGKKLDELAIKR